MNLTTWNPFREMEELLRRHQRGAMTLPSDDGGFEWAPAVDIKESKNEYLIEAELPGVAKEDVKVSVNNGVLTLEGERHTEKKDEDEKHHRVERFYGHFQRSFSLPEDVEVAKIGADSKDGLIRVHLPKTKVTTPKSVEIKVN